MKAAAIETLDRLSTTELGRLFANGRRVTSAELVGQRFFGRSLAQPGVVLRLTWQTFRKEIDAAGDGINVMVPQPWHHPARPERRHMPFALTDTDDGAVIDYRARHRLPHPLGVAVDPVRRIDDGTGPMVLLGVTELWLWGRRLRTPTWFSLTPASHVESHASGARG
jgi:hypothetical protein